VVLKQSEEDALEECLLVMKPCDPADMDDECLDEEVRHRIHGCEEVRHRIHGCDAPKTLPQTFDEPSVPALGNKFCWRLAFRV